MKKRIFWSICLTAFITLSLASALIITAFFGNFIEDYRDEIAAEALYIGKAAEKSGIDYLSAVGLESKNRITLISPEGEVLFDNLAPKESLDNHLSRPEVQAAIKSGRGGITRLSDTLGENTYYYAIKLGNGNILRLASTTKSAFGVLGRATIWMALIFVLVLIIASIVASILTKTIVKPINKLDLDAPLSNDSYEELSPLLLRMEKQNGKIKEQINLLSKKQIEFDYITGSMIEGLVILGDKGNVLSANNSAKKLFGSDAGHNYLQLCREAGYIKAVESALCGKSATTKIERDGRTYQLSANPVRGKTEPFAAVLFIVDITEKEQSEKMRREFSANVSHELKTPLTSILGCAEIIENGIAKEADIPRFAGQIYSEASRLLTLIEDIIKLSRLDEGSLTKEFEKVSLNDICNTVIDELSEKAEKANVTIKFDGEPLEVSGIKSVLHEMVYNLCDNAITYNKNNGSVEVKIYNEQDKTVLSVTDSGIGIAPEHQARVFERFYRVDKSHSKATGGTGLGLSIVKHGAMLHGAEVVLKSEIGKGTKISVIFNF